MTQHLAPIGNNRIGMEFLNQSEMKFNPVVIYSLLRKEGFSQEQSYKFCDRYRNYVGWDFKHHKLG